MKKGLMLIALIALFTVGCNATKEYESTMEEYAQTFYNEHQKGNVNLTNPTISIAQLKEAVEMKLDDFDMSKLAKCKDSSYTELIINQESREIEKYVHHLECE